MSEKYIIVSGHYEWDFVKKVNEKIDEGYVPQGGATWSSGAKAYCQAMIRFDQKHIDEAVERAFAR